MRLLLIAMLALSCQPVDKPRTPIPAVKTRVSSEFDSIRIIYLRYSDSLLNSKNRQDYLNYENKYYYYLGYAMACANHNK